MELELNADSLVCSEFRDAIDDTGYQPATRTGDGYDPLTEAAVCGACGFDEIGIMGCVSELDEVVDRGEEDVLLYVRQTDAGFEVVSEKS